MHLHPIKDTAARWTPRCPARDRGLWNSARSSHSVTTLFDLYRWSSFFLPDDESRLSISVLCEPMSLVCTYILRSESGSAVCLPSIRGSVFLNASVKGELTCSGRFPPAYCYKQHLSRSAPCTRRASLYACVYMRGGESFKFIKYFSIFFFPRSARLSSSCFPPSLSRTMVWPQPFPSVSALPSNTQHIVSIERAFNWGEKIYRYWRKKEKWVEKTLFSPSEKHMSGSFKAGLT